jgi:hypothetical protein
LAFASIPIIGPDGVKMVSQAQSGQTAAREKLQYSWFGRVQFGYLSKQTPINMPMNWVHYLQTALT